MNHARSRVRTALVSTAAFSLTMGVLTSGAQAQMSHSMSDMKPKSSAMESESASTQAFKESDATMMKKMGASYSGDTDRDFVSHMIPHHEGAVSMAQIELKYGKDPELKKLAADIVAAQDKEIAFMKAWQAKHAVK